MKKPAFLITVFIFLAGNIFAQDLRKKAEENPLDCAYYLLDKETPDERDSQIIADLALNYFEAARYDDAFNSINLFDSAANRLRFFRQLSTKFLAIGKQNEATKFLTEAVKNAKTALEDEPDTDNLVILVHILIELNRADEAVNIAKIFATEFEGNVTLAVAEKFLQLGQTEKLREFMAQPFFPHESENNLTRAKIALIYAKIKQTEKARKILEELKQTAFFGESEMDANNNRRRILSPLLRIHLELGETEKAFDLWNQRGDQEDFYEIRLFIDDLIIYGHKEKVSLLIAQMQLDKEQFEREGYEVVAIYLKIGDVKSALYVAKTMSENNDNYWQQDSFVKLADRFIADGNAKAAENILDFAFGRAKKVVYERYNGDSTSPGIRKVGYFRNIYQRLMKLKRFDKALTVINSISNDDSLAKKFVMESLADFVRQQIKTLSRKKIDKILVQILTTFNDEDESDSLTNAKILVAEIYAQIGEKTKAVEILSSVLDEAIENYYREDERLLSAGKIFEQNNLKADANLRKVLKKYIEDAE